MNIKKHFLDKPILKNLFWFIVLPYRLKMFIASQKPMVDDPENEAWRKR